jgi:hypothetical protein
MPTYAVVAVGADYQLTRDVRNISMSKGRQEEQSGEGQAVVLPKAAVELP